MKRPEQDRIVKLCTAISQIGGHHASEVLLKLLDHPVSRIRTAALYKLKKLRYQIEDPQKEKWVWKLIDRKLHSVFWCMKAEQTFKKDKALHHLSHALELEKGIVLEQLFILLTFIYDRQVIINVEENLDMNEKESRANAIEMLDNLLPKHYSVPLIVILDEHPKVYKLTFLSHQFNVKESTIVDFAKTIFIKGTGNFSRWTIAVALMACNSLGQLYREEWIKTYLESVSKVSIFSVFHQYSRSVLLTNYKISTFHINF